MSPTSSLRPSRGQRPKVAVFLGVLVVGAATLAACTTGSDTPPAGSTRVLGQQSASATVVGQPAPAGTGALGAISCADAEHCWAVGIPGPNADLTPIAKGAPSPGIPITVITATADGGATWVAQLPGLRVPPELSGISCPSLTACMAVGSTGALPGAGIVLTTRDGGVHWVAATVPAGAFAVTAVQCSTITDCTAIESDGTNILSVSSATFGRSWVTGGTLPAGFTNPRSLDCTGGAAGTGGAGPSCLVAGYLPASPGHGQGAIAVSGDGGTTWTAATVPAGSGLLEGTACPSTLNCLAVGTTSTTVSDVVPATGLILQSADGGHTWTTEAAPPPIGDIYGVDCPTPKACVIVGTRWQGTPSVGSGAVAHSSDGGQSFSRSITAYTPLTLTAVTCPTATNCTAVGGDSLARITVPAAPLTPTTTPVPSRQPLR